MRLEGLEYDEAGDLHERSGVIVEVLKHETEMKTTGASVEVQKKNSTVLLLFFSEKKTFNPFFFN